MGKEANEKKGKLKEIFDRNVMKKAEPIIAQKREKLAKQGRELTPKQEEAIIKRTARKMKRVMAFRGFLAALGITSAFGIGMNTQKLLNETNDKGITQTEETIDIDAVEAEKDINIKNVDKNNSRQVFVNGVHVDLEEQEDEMKKNIEEKIDSLPSKSAVLKYIKSTFLGDYNANNGTQYNDKDISIYKDIYSINMIEDKAKNGDDILRSKYDSTETYEKGVYTVEIETENGLEKQKIARNDDDKCVRVYDDEEVVDQYKENEASILGEVIMAGTDYAISMEQAKTDISVKEEYKNRLVDAIADYKNKKIERIINEEGKTDRPDNGDGERVD